MFNGIPDQFYQVIDSRIPLTLPLPHSLPLHVSPSCFSGLDPPPSHQLFQPHHLLNQLHRQSPAIEDEEQEEEREVSRSLELQGLKSTSQLTDPWTEEEIFTLWRVRSSIESGFSDFVWEHVSRKLAELGFKRSAEKCKEKFEEVSKFCYNTSYNKNYRSLSELEALFEGVNPNSLAEQVVISDEGRGKMKLNLEENPRNGTLVNPSLQNKHEARNSKLKKRKRYHKLKLLKGFCEEIVNNIVAQQEQLQNKLIEDMGKREKERVAREEAWRKLETARMEREIEILAHEQAIACDRETTIIEILKKFTSSPSQNQALLVQNEDLLKTPSNPNTQNNLEVPTSSTLVLAPQNPSSSPTQNNPDVPGSSTVALAPLNPNSTTTQTSSKVPTSSTPPLASQNHNSLAAPENPLVPTSPTTLLAPSNPNYASSDREDHGKRWPREEVYSLINLRCNLYSSVEDKEGSKVSLWERISQGMLQLGYRRSAKRCKEKWENINKYFRKTRDANKKRSLDSKTCPYFHQLSSLYNQGKLVLPSEGPENHSNSPENHFESPETHLRSSQSGFNEANMHADEGQRNSVQVPALEFEY